MISYAELLFRLAHKYQKERDDLLSEKDGKLKGLQKYRGSAGYEDDVKAVEKKYAALLDSLKATFQDETERVLKGMDKAISGRKMDVPTDGQLRLLQVLKMKSGALTLDDLNEAGEALRGCPAALAVLDDLAGGSGYPMKYHRLGGQMPTKKAADIIAGLREQMRDFAESDRSRAGRLAAKYHEKYGGGSVIPHRRTFETKDEFYSMFSGLDPEELAAFTEATGGGSTND